MSMMNKIRAEQDARRAKLSVAPEAEQTEAPEETAPVAEAPQKAAPKTKPARRRQVAALTLEQAPKTKTRQLGYRINEETIDAFEDWKDSVVSLARKQGRAKPTHGDLVELALKRLMLSSPSDILG